MQNANHLIQVLCTVCLLCHFVLSHQRIIMFNTYDREVFFYSSLQFNGPFAAKIWRQIWFHISKSSATLWANVKKTLVPFSPCLILSYSTPVILYLSWDVIFKGRVKRSFLPKLRVKKYLFYNLKCNFQKRWKSIFVAVYNKEKGEWGHQFTAALMFSPQQALLAII